MKNRKKTGFALISAGVILFMLFMGPMDGFKHGFFAEEIDTSQIAEQDWHDMVDLTNGYQMSFSPKKSHFAGISIYLKNQPEGNTGFINMAIKDLEGKVLENVKVDLTDVHDSRWYKVYTNVKLNKENIYTLDFRVEHCNMVPCFQRVDKDYLPDETVEGDILISYAYSKPTFTFQNKIIISLFIISVWIFLLGTLVVPSKRRYGSITGVIIFITSLMTWNYMYNSMDNQNRLFYEFQEDSETLVNGVIYAEQNGVWFENADEQGFGLGRYYDLKGIFNSYQKDYISDDNWFNGYSRNEPAILVHANDYSRRAAVVGNSIRFKNGACYQITGITDDISNLVIHLNSERILSSAKYGSLDEITFLDSNGAELAKSGITAYKSQYGLQGRVFRHLARYMDQDEAVNHLNLICSLATAFIFAMIVVMIFEKYNAIMAGCFLITFWLSPWIVNFARNLYWVEYTWFIPMAVGLFCAWKIDSRKCRIASYVVAFIAIMGKSLCGYEYISAVMLGLISFLLVDFAVAVIQRDQKKSALLFRTIFIIGIVALAGFMAAICIHAPLKGDGNLIEGIKNIIKEDVLRRTNGANLNYYDTVYWPSINASIWEVLCQYFHFPTEIIQGITGNLFSLICIIPLCIMGYDIKYKKAKYESIALYIVFFLTSISWFCLAKSHSYIHAHMNYVLWYFGFVQICFYIIADRIVSAFKSRKKEEEQ